MNQSSRDPAFRAVGGAPVFNAPLAVVLLLAAIIFSHFAITFAPRAAKIWMQAHGSVSPQAFIDALKRGNIAAAVAPLFTHVFIHANFAHLALNSLWLLAFGAPVARRLETDAGAGRGGRLFLLLFILSGAAGGLTYIAAHPGDYTLLVGASGGVSGLLGGLVRFAFYRPERGDAGRLASLADRGVIVWSAAIVILNLAIGLLGGFIFGASSDIAWEAHLGGYFFGLLAFPLVDAARR